MSGTTNLKLGVICAIGASLCFSLNDMVIKFFSGDYALHQVVLTRSLIGMVFTLAILIPVAKSGIAVNVAVVKLEPLSADNCKTISVFNAFVPALF